MKIKYFYILIIIFFSGCNEFIDLTGKFINRLNDTNNSTFTLNVSVINNQLQFLPNLLVSIIDDHDSLLIASPKFTNENSCLTFSFPDEQVRGISPKAQNLIIIAEHPDLGTLFNTIPVISLNNDQNSVSEFIIDIPQKTLLKPGIDKYSYYIKLQKKFMY